MSIFSRVFRKQPQNTKPAAVLGTMPFFTPFSGNAYESDVYRAAVDAIARHMGKLKGTHYIRTESSREPGDKDLNYLLQIRPNPYMPAYDLVYKLATHYYIFNNAFALIQRDGNAISGIYPLNVSSMTFLTDPTDTLYCKFFFKNGSNYIFPYADIIHMRRHFNDNELLGDTNTAILPALRLSQAQSDGIVNGIKSGASIRGIMKYNQVLAPDKLKEARDAFMADYLSIENSGGVAAMDTKFDYIPLKQEPYTIDDKQLDAVKSKIYEYLGVSQKIVDGSYGEETGTAFYESVVEPWASQLSQEITAKIFTPIEQKYGNAILFESAGMDYVSYKTRMAALTATLPVGLLTTDEARQILNLPTIGGEEGRKRLVSLNFVQADKQNQYQLGEKEDTE